MREPNSSIGDYRIVSHLSDGGMASLYLGRRAESGPDDAPVAIKIIHEHLSEDWQFVRMFVDEALISVRLRHPNVVRVDELGEEESVYYLVMEYVHGCSLAELLRAMGKAGRRMRPEIAVYIASQVAAGLHSAHQMTGHDGQLLGIIHRDVSPQNVLLSVDGQVKLLDFGIAKAKGRAERTEAGVIKGKVRYMAPEQAGGETLDRRVDIYALGVMLWESLTMRRYIEGKSDLEVIRKVRNPEPVSPSTRAAGIDPRIDDAVMAALEPDAPRRPPTAEAFQRLLDGAVPQGTVGAPHIAELLRVFLGDEIVERAAALPEEVSGPLVQRAQQPTPLPDDALTGPIITPEDRTRTLTMEATAPPEPEPEPPAEEVPTRSFRAAGPIPGLLDDNEIRATIRQDSPFETEAEIDVSELPSFGDHDDEKTVEASGHELATFLQRIRAESGEGPAVGPSTAASIFEPTEADARRPEIPRPQQPSGEAYAPLQPPPAPEAKPPPRNGNTAWLIRVLLITVLAFVIGAGAAVAYVRFLR